MLKPRVPDPENGRLGVSEVAILTIAAALLVILIENGTNIVNRSLLHRINGATTGFLWIVPLFYGLVFGMLAIALMVVTRVLSRQGGVRLVVVCSVSVAAFSLLLLVFYAKVHQWALLLFALGVGTQAGRLAYRHTGRVLRAARAFTLVAAPLVLIPALGNPPLQRWLERRELASLVPARNGAPNVLLIILDTVRAASLSLYGHDYPTTPNIDRMASDAVVFDRAYSTTSWTLPSHAGMFTGYYPQELTADWVIPFEGGQKTLAEIFRDAGYQTGGFVSNLFYTQESSGLARGFNHYEDYLHTPGQLRRATALGQFLDTWDNKLKPARPTSARKNGRTVSTQFLTWLSGVEARPFFAFLNYFDAHQPYLAPPDLMPRSSSGRLGERYEAAITSLDREIAMIVDSLRHRGVLENTLIIITSDHGEQLGEHGLRGHGNSLYEASLHVPLVLIFGDKVPGIRVTEPVSLRDLPQTILALAGQDERVPGVSLVPLFGPGADSTFRPSPILFHIRKGIRSPPEEPISRGDMTSLIADTLHFIVNGDGKEELYALNQDLLEANNLSADPAAQGDLNRMRGLLREALKLSSSSLR